MCKKKPEFMAVSQSGNKKFIDYNSIEYQILFNMIKRCSQINFTNEFCESQICHICGYGFKMGLGVQTAQDAGDSTGDS